MSTSTDSTPPGSRKAIGKKLLRAMVALRTIGKDGTNSGLKYKYTSGALVLRKVNEALVNAGLVIVETDLRLVADDGLAEGTVTVAAKVVLCDPESDETVTFRGLGAGSDPSGGDKAVMKAETAALKYLWVAAFAIQMGDDPEEEESGSARLLANLRVELAVASTLEAVVAAWCTVAPALKEAGATPLATGWKEACACAKRYGADPAALTAALKRRPAKLPEGATVGDLP